MSGSICTPPGRRPSRRTLIGAAAWSVPVIAVATATPAVAASKTPRLSFTLFRVSQKGQTVTARYRVRVAWANSVSASLTIELNAADGAALGSRTCAITPSPTTSGTETFDLPAGAAPHHATATLVSTGLTTLSATAYL